MDLFEYKEPESTAFKASDSQVRNLILEMNEQSGKVKDDDFVSPEIDGVDDDFEPQKDKKAFNKGIEITAEVLVKGADRIVAMFFGRYAMEPDETFYADDSDLADISRPLEIYFQDNKKSIPPWAVALFSAVILLIGKFNTAKILRSKNLEINKYKKETEDLKREIDLAKKERELIELRSELNQSRA